MTTLNSNKSLGIRAVIAEFLEKRRDDKLVKLSPDDSERAKLYAQFIPAIWLEDAARRVSQIQAVTHSLKPIHPDAKGSALYKMPSQPTQLVAVGTHSLGLQFDVDVVGNAAALDVYKFLKLSVGGESLLELAVASDADLAAALCDREDQAREWMAAFASLAQPRGEPSSHSNAKQLYWLTGTDAHDEQAFDLLAPLYPTSLVHRVYLQLQDDRFSEEAKAARAARKAILHHDRVVCEYPNLAIQKLGGTKPQNISQLNSERRGDNYLLASMPPVWKSADVRPMLHVADFFKVFGRRKNVMAQIRALRTFLEAAPAANYKTRQHVSEGVEHLIDDLVQFQAEMLTLPAGWTLIEECDLPLAQRVWLDPEAKRTESAQLANDDAADEVASDFARWFNNRLRNPLPVGDAEFIEWRRLAREQFAMLEREAA